MTARHILLLYFFIFGAEFIFHQIVNLLNLSRASRRIRGADNGEDELFQQLDPLLRSGAVIDSGHIKRSISYTRANMRYALIRTLAGSSVLLICVVTGVFGLIDTVILGLGLPARINGIVYIFTVMLGSALLSLLFTMYRQFVIEKRFGFSTMKPGTLLFDTLKGLIVSAVIGFIILYGIFLLTDLFPLMWWIAAFFFIFLFQVIATVIYPVLIAPLFNQFVPLEEGPLKQRLTGCAERLSVRTSGIYVMDGSRRSRHSNAYFSGLGRVKRIVLYDTLIDKLEDEEVEAVLAHEIGHEKRRHSIKVMAVMLIATAALLFAVSLILDYGPIYNAFGFEGAADYRMVLILLLLSGPLISLVQPLLNAWSRRFEYQADHFAAEALGSPGPMKRALLRLSAENLSNLDPHPLYSFYHYSHPAPAERLGALE